MPTALERKAASALSFSPAMSVPPTITRPLSAFSSPAMIASRVDLPAPDGPTTAMLSPRAARSEMPRRTLTGPALLLRVRWTSSRSTAGSAMSFRRSMQPSRWSLAAARLLWVFLAAPILPCAGAAGEEPRIVVLGDSLTAGYGLAVEDAFPAQLEAALRARGHAWRVVDAGVSGDTSAGGLARLDWVLADGPEVVIVELGANDGLRGLPTGRLEANLDAVLSRIREAGAAVLLAGMRPPANYGPDYAAAFEAVYETLSARHEVAFYPFFLEGVAMVPALNQPDGIHPNEAGVAEIVKRILAHVVAVIAGHKGE